MLLVYNVAALVVTAVVTASCYGCRLKLPRLLTAELQRLFHIMYHIYTAVVSVISLTIMHLQSQEDVFIAVPYIQQYTAVLVKC